MSETKPKTKPKNNPEDKVIRVHKHTYEFIKMLKGNMTFDSFILNAVSFTDQMAKQSKLYAVGDRLFEDLLDARGESILTAAKLKVPPKLPSICVIIGQDNGQ